MRKELISSLILHLVVILLILFVRLPQRLLKEEDLIIPIEIANIGDVTQSNKPLYAQEPKPTPKVEETPEPKPTPPVEPIKPPEPEPPEPPEPVTPEPPPEEVKPEPEPVVEKPEPEATPEPEEVLPPEDAIEEPEEKEEPKEKPKPPSLPKVKPKASAPQEKPKEEKKPKKEPKEKAKAKTSEMDKLLDTLIPEDAEKGEETESAGDETGDNLPKGDELMSSVEAAISRHLSRCWYINDGAKNAQDLVVPLVVEFNPDATVKQVEVVEKKKAQDDPVYGDASKRAVNAIKNPLCSPFPLPKNKYRLWKKLTINFRPDLRS